MEKSIISEGKTTNEAIEKGLKELNVSKSMVDIKVLENAKKRSFFSILAPRVVKVQLTLKENNVPVKKEKKKIELTVEEQEKAKANVEKFLNEFLEKAQKGTKYTVETTKTGLNVNLEDENLGFLIGYRGETLYALQNIISSVAGKGIENRVRVILDIEGYKAKRVKYERKIIHSKLQNSNKVETKSIGEEPRRKVVISLKK